MEYLQFSYLFNEVKPLIFNFDTTFAKGIETEFAMYMAADKMPNAQQDFPLEFEFQTNLKSELDLIQRNGTTILTYKPLETGKDTIKIEYFFRNPDSTKRMPFPIQYFVNVKD